MMNEKTPIAEILCHGKEVRIEAVNQYGNKIITKAMVLQIDDRNLILNLPKQGIFNQVNADVEVKVVCENSVYSRASEFAAVPQRYVFFSRFITAKEVEPPQVILSKPVGATVDSQSVEYYVRLPFSYFVNEKEIKGGIIKTLTTIDLHASIKPDDSLEIGLGIPFKLFLPTGPSPLLIMGTVVRLEKEADNFQIALDFSHIPNDLQDQIAKYLFSTQNYSAQKAQHRKAAFIKIN
jgi:hypothetical protein